MKLKKMVCALCAMFVGFSAVMFSGCSAYDVAVKNGFEGTQEEWLAQLKGEDGADGEDGKSLTFDELWEQVKDQYNSKEEFIRDIASFDVHQNDTVTIAQNMTSVVSVYCGFFHRPNVLAPVEVSASVGSGVVLSLNASAGSAYIVTNYHVVYSTEDDNGISESIYVYPYGALNTFSSKTGKDEYNGIRATYVGGAMQYDIALLKVENSDYIKQLAANDGIRAATLGDSDELCIGENTFAIGDGNGLGLSVSAGILSVDDEKIALMAADEENSVVFRVIRTDAAINHGNSGGALFDKDGKLIGITNAKNVEEETEGICYALPINQVKRVLENIWDNGGDDANGRVLLARLGITTQITHSIAYMDGDKLKVKEEITVYGKRADVSGAAKDVLSIGDVLLRFQLMRGGQTVLDKKILRQREIENALLAVRKGDKMIITVRRARLDGSTVERDVEVNFDSDIYFGEYA